MIDRFANWLGSTKAWKWFAEKYIGHMTFRMMGYPKFPMEDFFEIVNAMGSKNSIYCFASSDHDSLASMMIRRVTRTGKMSHGGVIVPGGVRGTRILHMKGRGPADQHLLDILREIDYFAVIEVKLSPENYKTALSRLNYIKNHKEKHTG